MSVLCVRTLDIYDVSVLQNQNTGRKRSGKSDDNLNMCPNLYQILMTHIPP